MKTFLRFNLVGALGILLQLTTLALLNHIAPHHYLLTSTCAVELAILHNFAWHQHYTWPQPRITPQTTLKRLLRFHFANGLISLSANLTLMPLFVHTLHFPILLANSLAIATSGVANFLLAHLWVFSHPPETSPSARTLIHD